MWQQNFLDSHVGPTFAFAPAAGRFALGRTIVSTPLEPDVPLAAGTVVAQEVRVYQSYDGKILFKIECTPVERAGQNFAMSDDGMRLAVVRETQVRHSATKDYDAYMETQAAVEVYSLPELTKEDTAALKAAEKLAPEDSGVRIDLALMKSSGGSGSAQNGAAAAPPEPLDVPAPAPPVEAGTPSPAVAGTQPAGDAADAGNATTDDSAPAESRKAPTLYSPDEKQPKKGPQ
jgi:hypothetical protein